MKRSILDVTSRCNVSEIRETVETRWVAGRRRLSWLRAGTSLLLTLVALVLAPPPAAQAREPDVLECQQHAAGLLPSTLVSANRLRRANLLPDRVSVDGGLTSDRDHRDESTWTEDVVSGELTPRSLQGALNVFAHAPAAAACALRSTWCP